ncbi:hypothetical protein Aduo_016248 [Ancylostoma duodenale]
MLADRVTKRTANHNGNHKRPKWSPVMIEDRQQRRLGWSCGSRCADKAVTQRRCRRDAAKPHRRRRPRTEDRIPTIKREEDRREVLRAPKIDRHDERNGRAIQQATTRAWQGENHPQIMVPRGGVGAAEDLKSGG